LGWSGLGVVAVGAIVDGVAVCAGGRGAGGIYMGIIYLALLLESSLNPLKMTFAHARNIYSKI